jgi:uncharacterized C2H2 Zn-finger protein
MRSALFMLPNGFSDGAGGVVREIELRKLDGNDEDFILDKVEMKRGNVLNRLIKRVLVRVGNVTDPMMIEKVFDERFLMADTTFMLVSLRSWGISPIYRFEASCPRCEKIGKHRVDLRKLVVDEQPEAARGQDTFTEVIDLEDGEKVTVKFRPLFVRDEHLLLSIKSDYAKEKATKELLMQIQQLNGEVPDASTIKALDWSTRNAIRQVMDSKSGGIDTELLMECKACGKTFKDSMPIEVRSFFFPAAGSPKTEMEATPYRVSITTSESSGTSTAGHPRKSAP